MTTSLFKSQMFRGTALRALAIGSLSFTLAVGMQLFALAQSESAEPAVTAEATSAPTSGNLTPYPVMVTPFRVGLATRVKRSTLSFDSDCNVFASGKKIAQLQPSVVYRLDVGGIWDPSGARVVEMPDERLHLAGKDFRFNLNGTWYRGALEVFKLTDKGITAIGLLDLEDYLLGVVPTEIPSIYALEALKAQAVLARTYAYNQRSQKNGWMDKEGYDIPSNLPEQPYRGLDVETPATLEAVNSTRGLIIETASAVKPVSKHSTEYDLNLSSKSISTAELETVAGVSDIESIEIKLVTPDGLAQAVEVRGAHGTRMVSGVALADRLKLPSASIAHVVKGEGNTWTVYCRAKRTQKNGSLSQVGANALAEGGWRFDQILSQYLQVPGSEFKLNYMPHYKAHEPVSTPDPKSNGPLPEIRSGETTTTASVTAAAAAETVTPDKTADTPKETIPAAPTAMITPAKSRASAQLPARPVRDKWAVVVGISHFNDPSINLRYAANDAVEFRNYLINEAGFSPDHVQLLLDKDATRSNILGKLSDQWLKRLARPDDLVVVYISTHGTSLKRDVAGVNFLVAADTQPSNLLSTAIPMEWLSKIVEDQVLADRVLMILDVCHSGVVAPASKGLLRQSIDVDQIAIGKGQVIMTSSDSDQVSWESKNAPNGVFTRWLLTGLRQKGKNTTINEAFQFTRERVQDEVLRDRGELQTPVLKRAWQGSEIILSVKPVQPSPGLTPSPKR